MIFAAVDSESKSLMSQKEAACKQKGMSSKKSKSWQSCTNNLFGSFTFEITIYCFRDFYYLPKSYFCLIFNNFCLIVLAGFHCSAPRNTVIPQQRQRRGRLQTSKHEHEQCRISNTSGIGFANERVRFVQYIFCSFCVFYKKIFDSKAQLQSRLKPMSSKFACQPSSLCRFHPAGVSVIRTDASFWNHERKWAEITIWNTGIMMNIKAAGGS